MATTSTERSRKRRAAIKAADMAEVRNIIAPTSQHAAIKAHVARKFKLGEKP